MKYIIFGGTGLLGSAAAKQLIKDGHFVSALALPPIPKGASLPKEMKLFLHDYNTLSDDVLLSYMKDCQGFVFASGVDERVEGTSPIEAFYHKYNIQPLQRLLPIAKRAGVKHAVILGSYFSYFNDVWQDLELTKHHPYIKNRVEQEQVALSFADEKMSVSVLQLPYIFGVQPGRKPVWVFLVEQLLSMRPYTFYPKGGTTMVTVDQVGKLIAEVLYHSKKEKRIPVGYYNKTWKEMLEGFHKGLGLQRKIITIPTWLYRLVLKSIARKNRKQKIETGLDLSKLADIMSRNAFIDRKHIEVYGVKDDDIDQAIIASAKLSLEVINDGLEMIDMRVEE